MGGTDPLEVLLIEAAFEGSTTPTFCAVLLEGTGIAGSRIGSILLHPFGVAVLFETQEGTLWTRIGVLFGIILELLLSIEWRSLVKVMYTNLSVAVIVC